MKVFCVKYALSSGIRVVEGEESKNGRFMIKENGFYQSLSKNEWARTAEEALDLAECAREKKIASLTKQIEKLSNMEISLP